MLEQLANADVAVIPVGGGGLIAGVALAMKTLNPDVTVIGVEPRRCASFTAALAAGAPVPAETLPTLADGLAVPMVGPHAFAVARHWVDEVVLVEEREVALSVLRLVEGEKQVVPHPSPLTPHPSPLTLALILALSSPSPWPFLSPSPLTPHPSSLIDHPKSCRSSRAAVRRASRRCCQAGRSTALTSKARECSCRCAYIFTCVCVPLYMH